MFSILIIAALIVSIVSLFKGVLGLAFILALFVFLCNLITLVNKESRLSNAGIIYMVLSIMILIYCGCSLFLGINMRELLRFQ